MSTGPRPMFSRVANLIFLNATVCQVTSTVAVGQQRRRQRVARRALAGDPHVAFEHRLRVVVGLAALDVRHLAEQIELAHEIRLAVVQVDRLGIDELRGADRVDVGDDVSAVGGGRARADAATASAPAPSCVYQHDR